MMSFEQFQNYTKNNCQSFHWASKKADPMLTCNNSTSQPTNQANQTNAGRVENKLERKNSKLNLKDTPMFGTSDFRTSDFTTSDLIWTRNDTSNDLLKKFRNYEI